MRTLLMTLVVLLAAALLVQGCSPAEKQAGDTKTQKAQPQEKAQPQAKAPVAPAAPAAKTPTAPAAKAPEAAAKTPAAPAAKTPTAAEPVNEVRADGLLSSWNAMVFSISSEASRDKGEPYFTESFDKDYLASMGGQDKAALASGASVKYKDGSGAEKKAEIASMQANSVGWVSSEYDEAAGGRKVIYAFCNIKSDKAQKVTCYFGSDDEANIWINGALVHKTYVPRSCEARQDEFKVELKQGMNPVMVKASQRSQSWVFVLEAIPAK